MRRSDRLTRDYLSIDPRSLGAGRIALALCLLLDLLRRVPLLTLWYSNLGLLPNHTVLWQPAYPYAWSFFFMASRPSEVAIGFLLCAAAYTMLLFGFRTRTAQLASLLCVLSLHGRLLMLENSGDAVLSQLCLWTLFLPTGRHYSVDSLRASLRAFPDRDDGDLADRDRLRPDPRPFVSWAVLVLLVQLAIIYFLSAVQKTGATWRMGSAVYDVLHQDRIVTGLGLWVRGWLPPAASRLLSWSVRITEFLLPALLLSPVATRSARRLALLLVVALHLGFALFINLAIFVPAMIAFVPNFVSTEDWDRLGRWSAGRRGKCLVLYDGRSGLCFQAARILARLDPGGRLRFVSTERLLVTTGELEGVALSPAEREASVVVIDPANGRRWDRAAAVAELARFVPVGFLLAWLLRLPPLRAVADAACTSLARHRASLSAWLGLSAPVTFGADGQAPVARPVALGDSPPGSSPAREALRALGGRVRGAALAGLALLAAVQVVIDNRITNSALHDRHQPRWMEASADYLQLFEGWALFAPDTPRTDMNITVDAITRDGRHVDPYNEATSARFPSPGFRVPPRLEPDALACDYVTVLPFHPEYQQAFQEWILRYPERTRHSNDQLVSFRAFLIEDDSPPLGVRQPRNTRASQFLAYPN